MAPDRRDKRPTPAGHPAARMRQVVHAQGLIHVWRYAPAVGAEEMLPDIAICRELASALRAGDDSAAAGLAARAAIPRWLLTHPEFGPRGQLDVGDAGEALGCIS